MTVKLLVADDHEVVRTGLASLLAGSEIKIVAEAANGAEAVKMAVKHKPDVVLLDIRMPDSDGLEALDKIHRELPEHAGRHAVDLRQSHLCGPCGRLGRKRLRAEGGQPSGVDLDHHRRRGRQEPVAYRRATEGCRSNEQARRGPQWRRKSR